MRTEKDQHPATELPPELVNGFMTTFIGRSDCYPLQLHDGTFITAKLPLTPHLVIDHLKGEVTLGAYALDQEHAARWLCLDADTQEQWQGLKRLAGMLETNGVTPYLELSRRGGHLWLFVSPTPGKTIRQFGKELIRTCDLGKIELYPKQDDLKTGCGSLVRLPFGIHRKTGRRYHFITSTDEPLAATIREQIGILSHPTLVPQAYIAEVLASAPEPEVHSPTPLPNPSEPGTGEILSERLKNTISVYQFVSHYVALDQQGKGFCPFHDDDHKSFQVNIQGNYWNCYADCGGGSIIDFWIKWRETHGQDGSFVETIKELRQMLI